MKYNDKDINQLKKQQQNLKRELSAVSDKISELVETKLLPKCKEYYTDTYWVNKGIGIGGSKYIHVKTVEGISDTKKDINCILICSSFQYIKDSFMTFNFKEVEYSNFLEKRITKSEYEKAKEAAFYILQALL
jgi:hypothetical protein